MSETRTIKEADASGSWALIEARGYTGAAAFLEEQTGAEARHALGYAYTFAGYFDKARAVYG